MTALGGCVSILRRALCRRKVETPMDRFEAMSLLLEVVDKGSLSAAGRALRVPVPTLSRKISDLEALLGTRLLVRTTRKLTLTDAGLAYVTAARRSSIRSRRPSASCRGVRRRPRGIRRHRSDPVRPAARPSRDRQLPAVPRDQRPVVLADRKVHLVDDHVESQFESGNCPTAPWSRRGSDRCEPSLRQSGPACASWRTADACGPGAVPVRHHRCPMPLAGWRFNAGGSAAG